jgi:hypothetical protein
MITHTQKQSHIQNHNNNNNHKHKNKHKRTDINIKHDHDHSNDEQSIIFQSTKENYTERKISILIPMNIPHHHRHHHHHYMCESRFTLLGIG